MILSMGDKSMADWRVDPALAPAIEEVLPDLAREILATIALEVPEYARPLEGSCGPQPNGEGTLACVPAERGRRELSGRELVRKLDQLEREIQGT